MSKTLEELDISLKYLSEQCESNTGKINKIEHDISKIKIDANTQKLQIESMVKLPESLDSLKESIMEMKSSMDALRMQFKQTENDLKFVKEEIYAETEKGKFDISLWIKENWVWIIVLAILIIKEVDINV